MTSHKHPHVCHQSEMLVEILFTDPDLHSADLIFVGTGGTGGPVKFFLTVYNFGETTRIRLEITE